MGVEISPEGWKNTPYGARRAPHAGKKYPLWGYFTHHPPEKIPPMGVGGRKKYPLCGHAGAVRARIMHADSTHITCRCCTSTHISRTSTSPARIMHADSTHTWEKNTPYSSPTGCRCVKKYPLWGIFTSRKSSTSSTCTKKIPPIAAENCSTKWKILCLSLVGGATTLKQRNPRFLEEKSPIFLLGFQKILVKR